MQDFRSYPPARKLRLIAGLEYDEQGLERSRDFQSAGKLAEQGDLALLRRICLEIIEAISELNLSDARDPEAVEDPIFEKMMVEIATYRLDYAIALILLDFFEIEDRCARGDAQIVKAAAVNIITAWRNLLAGDMRDVSEGLSPL